ncbi:MAG: glycosyltransferase [Firmicutes bacterium]|nr:glycosyltransferase [Bacillota bacterium]
MKKIALFQTDLGYGGIQKSIINLLNSLDYNKYEVDLYLFSRVNVFNDLLNDNVKIIYKKSLPYITKFVDFELLNKMYSNTIEKEYDVAIDFNSYSMDTALACLNVKAKKKVIWVHNDIKIKLKEEGKYRVLYHFFSKKYKYYDAFVAVSKGALDSFKEYNKYNSKQYLVIPNIINTEEIFNLINEKENINVDESKYNLCSVGRLSHQKGFDILLDDVKQIVQNNFNFHLYIIGDGPKKKQLIKQINCLQLNKYVTLLGAKNNVYSILNKMDGFVLTSRYEGQGMVFLEAKALGLDIIMPKHLEKYIDGINGTNDIVKSILKLKKHEKKYNSLKSYNNDIIKKINNLLGK